MPFAPLFVGTPAPGQAELPQDPLSLRTRQAQLSWAYFSEATLLKSISGLVPPNPCTGASLMRDLKKTAHAFVCASASVCLSRAESSKKRVKLGPGKGSSSYFPGKQIAIQQRYDLHNKIKQEKLRNGEFYGEEFLPSVASILADLLGPGAEGVDLRNDTTNDISSTTAAPGFVFEHSPLRPTLMVWPQQWARQFTAVTANATTGSINDALITLVEIGSWQRVIVTRSELDSIKYVAISHHWQSQSSSAPWTFARTEQVRGLIEVVASATQILEECGGTPLTHYWLDIECVDQDDFAGVAASLALSPSIYQMAALVYVVTDLDDHDTLDAWVDRVWTMRELLLAKRVALNSSNGSVFDKIYSDRLSFYSQADHFSMLGYLLKKNSARSCYDKRDLYYSLFGLNATANSLDFRPEETFEQLTVRAARAALSAGDYSLIGLNDQFGVDGLGLLGFADYFDPDGANQEAYNERVFVEPDSSVGWRKLANVSLPQSRNVDILQSSLISQLAQNILEISTDGVKLRAKAVPATLSSELAAHWAGLKDRADAARECVKDYYIEKFMPNDLVLARTGSTPASLLPPSETVEGELDFVPLFAWAARFLQPAVITMPGQAMVATGYSMPNVYGLGQGEQAFLKKHATSPIALVIVELKIRLRHFRTEATFLALRSPQETLEETALLCALVSCEYRHVFGVRKRAHLIKLATSYRVQVGWDRTTPFGAFRQPCLDAVVEAALFLIWQAAETVCPTERCFVFDYAGASVAINLPDPYRHLDTMVVADGVFAQFKADDTRRGSDGSPVFRVSKDTNWHSVAWMDAMTVVRGAPFARRTPKQFWGSETAVDQYQSLIDLPPGSDCKETVILV
ncbi:hypothetical protein DFJ73DRAFT_905682 [Zopfochytrium polystomum]|nr:hypothetical protein DFJ73DRAFT_905682 [Zopfochytrium polystomum]